VNRKTSSPRKWGPRRYSRLASSRLGIGPYAPQARKHFGLRGRRHTRHPGLEDALAFFGHEHEDRRRRVAHIDPLHPVVGRVGPPLHPANLDAAKAVSLPSLARKRLDPLWAQIQ